MALDHDHCFLCGVELISGNRTEEHVFPRWMQREYDLWTQHLTLLNGTTIQYRSLTIPCCEDCNTFWLSQIEDVVAPAFRAGPDAVQALDPSLLCLWLSKIYYGIHFKEIALPADRRDPGGLTIGSPAALVRFRELHLVMQAMRKRVLFGGPPGSIRIFRAQVPGEARHRFDYKDLREVPFLGLRAGATVVLGALLDWGAMAGATAATFTAAEELELHPSQFEEVAAFAAYNATKFNREFAYLVTHRGDHDVIEPVIVRSPDDDPDEPVYEPFVLEEMALVLAEFTGKTLPEVYDDATGRIWTNLRNDDGSPSRLSLDDAPIGTRVVRPGWIDPAES